MNKTKRSVIKPDIGLHDAAIKAGFSSFEYVATRDWLVEQLLAHEYAKLSQGGHTQNQVPLRRVFVDLPVTDSLSAVSEDGPRMLFLETLLSSTPIKLNEVCQRRISGVSSAPDMSSEGESRQRKVESRNLRRGVRCFSATLLIGGPGQGKSTLGQLACQLHRAALLKPLKEELTLSEVELVNSFDAASSSDGQALSLPNQPYFPLQISLPEAAAWLAKEQLDREGNNTPILLHFLADLPSARQHGLSADNLLNLASHMPSLIVLDGFDEVGATQDRERLVIAANELLTTLAQRRVSAQIIATTRPQGYAGELAQIGISLKELYLVPLLRDEALKYAKKLVEAKISGADQQTKTLSRLYEAAAEPATERLLTTPLQITILTALVQQLGRAPRERWNLFYRYFSYTYEREIERETYASRLLAEHRSHIEQIHARVALLLQVEAERDGGASARMSRAQLESVIEAVLAEDEVSDTELVHDIAVAAEHRLVFLVEPEPGSFGFEIRSLQEFMAAWALASGRDTEIVARLQQVAKASMFRNVTLFIASRLYSDGSPLRDELPDKICGKLDEGVDDELTHLTHAGGLLALETLEEGAVLSQPKRARALMTRATGLLDLPPSKDHARLARVANDDTTLIFTEAIEKRIKLAGEKQNDALAAWVCIVESANRKSSWAMHIGDSFWHLLTEPTSLLQACLQADIPMGEWLSNKIERFSTKIYPEDFIDFRVFSIDSKNESWASWLAHVYEYDNNFRSRRNPTLHLSLVEKTFEIDKPEPQNRESPPEHWKVWVAAARFEISPSAQNLATVLEFAAEFNSNLKLDWLKWRSSWPLAGCIGSADKPKALLKIASRLRSGSLGDIDDWRSAEGSWLQSFSLEAALEHIATENMPWSLESLKRAPPISAIPIWVFYEHAHQRPNQTKRDELLRLANQAFIKNPLGPIKTLLAELCLLIFRNLSTKTSTEGLSPSEWLNVAPHGVGFMVPRPKTLKKPEWLSLLSSKRSPISLHWFISLESALSALVESNAHPTILRITITYVRLYSRSFSTGKKENLSIIPKAMAALEKARPNSTIENADVAIMKLFLGYSPIEEDDKLLTTVTLAASETPSTWDELICAVKNSYLASTRSTNLLAKIYRAMGKTQPQASQVIRLLRDALQTRKSDLDNHITWNRLALPLPYPDASPSSSFSGALPKHPVILESLELRDIRGFHHTKLKFKKPPTNKGQWIVFLGKNGIGKTTILQSLVLALRNTKDPAIWPKGTFANSWLRATGNNDPRILEAKISVKIEGCNEQTTTVRTNGSFNINQSPEQERPRLFPIFAYGCRRGSALGGVARQVDLTDDDGPEVATLFDEGADLIHAETWLIQLEGDAPKNPRSKIIFEAVISAIKNLLDLESIEVSHRTVWAIEHNRPKLPFSSLSDGYLTSAGWFLDLIARWVNLAEKHNKPLDEKFLSQMRGLVLIDEIDLHLHPRWQIEIISRTRELLPLMSFVATTHNPLTLVGAQAEEIWTLSTKENKFDALNGVETPMLLTGGQIYRRYFGIEDIYPNGLGRSLQRYSFLSGFDLRNDTEEAELENLQKELNEAGLIPEWEIVTRKKTEAASLPEATTQSHKQEESK